MSNGCGIVTVDVLAAALIVPDGLESVALVVLFKAPAVVVVVMVRVLAPVVVVVVIVLAVLMNCIRVVVANSVAGSEESVSWHWTTRDKNRKRMSKRDCVRGR